MRKVAARLVPHHLTSDLIERRLKIATDLLSRFTEEGNDFLSRIVAIDENLVRYYEPELKSQASEWHTSNSPRPAKFRRTQWKIKMLMIFADDIYGNHEPLSSKLSMVNITENTFKNTYDQVFVRSARVVKNFPLSCMTTPHHTFQQG